MIYKVADLSPIPFQKQAATDEMELNIDETSVWRLDSRPNLQPWFIGLYHQSSLFDAQTQLT